MQQLTQLKNRYQALLNESSEKKDRQEELDSLKSEYDQFLQTLPQVDQAQAPPTSFGASPDGQTGAPSLASPQSQMNEHKQYL